MGPNCRGARLCAPGVWTFRKGRIRAGRCPATVSCDGILRCCPAMVSGDGVLRRCPRKTAAERRNLRSPRRQPWESESHNSEPRSGDIYRTCSAKHRCRRSAALLFGAGIPNAHALGYVDCAAPRRPGVWTLRACIWNISHDGDTEGVIDGRQNGVTHSERRYRGLQRKL